MTVTSEITRVFYTGNGVTIAFPVTFPFLGSDEIEVIERVIASGAETVKTLNTDYLVNGGDGSTGVVTAVTAPAATVEWHIRRKTARLQPIDYVAGDDFPAETHERGLDRNIMVAQETQEANSRALRYPKTDDEDISAMLPSSAARAGKVMAFDDDGAPIVSDRTLEELEQLTDSEAAASASDAAASAAAALAAQLAAEAAAGSVDLPPIEVGKWLRGNAAANGWDLKSDAELAALIAGYLSPFTTGDVKPTFKVTADSGWVMMNDGSIGDASSSATTRANADCEALFLLLWTNIIDTWAPVSGGRGASAAADWAAHKRLILPKALGRALAVSGAGTSLTSRALGETLGAESVFADLAAHIHASGSLVAASDGDHTHTVPGGGDSGGAGIGTSAAKLLSEGDASIVATTSSDGAHTHTISGSTASAGTSAGHANMQPSTFLNVMVKL